MAGKTKDNSDAANNLLNQVGGESSQTGEAKTGENDGGALAPGSTTLEQPGLTAAPLIHNLASPSVITEPGTKESEQRQESINQEQKNQEINVKQAAANFDLPPLNKNNVAEDMKTVKTEDLLTIKTAVDSELASRSLITSTNQPTKDEAADLVKENLSKQYGEDYVTAKHKDGRETYFSRLSWKNLTPAKDGSRDGWQEVIEVPNEVKELQNK